MVPPCKWPQYCNLYSSAFQYNFHFLAHGNGVGELTIYFDSSSGTVLTSYPKTLKFKILNETSVTLTLNFSKSPGTSDWLLQPKMSILQTNY